MPVWLLLPTSTLTPCPHTLPRRVSAGGCLSKLVPSSCKPQVLYFKWSKKRHYRTAFTCDTKTLFHPASRSFGIVLAIEVLHYQKNFLFRQQKTFQEFPLKPLLRSGATAFCNLSMSAYSSFGKPLHWIL